MNRGEHGALKYRDVVDYDRLAPAYETRYSIDPLQGISDTLVRLASRRNAEKVLEVGCGTGHWLRELRPHVRDLYGADASLGMLHGGQHGTADLTAALANALPFRERSFDLVYCVNAVHHFGNPRAFIEGAAQLLRGPGALSLTGIDPRLISKWYFYEYFEGTYERDLRRFPAVGDLVNWMAAAGFDPIEYRVVQKRDVCSVGRSVFSDPFLKKNSNSQLALLTDAEYAAGLKRMENAIVRAEKEDGEVQFGTELPFMMITGCRR